MLTEIVASERAWRGESLRPGSWVMPIPSECLDELAQALASLRAHPLPLFLLRPEEFELEACRAFMKDVRRQLDDGLMFAVLDRLPVEIMSPEESAALYWLISTLLARPVAQKLDAPWSISCAIPAPS
jgi:hypothetical protein